MQQKIENFFISIANTKIGYAHFVIVSVKSKVGDIGRIIATPRAESDDFKFESSDVNRPVIEKSLEATMVACRSALQSPSYFHIEFESRFLLSGTSLNAAAALAVLNLMQPEMRTDGLLATGSFKDDKFIAVGDIDEKALTAERHKLKFVYPKENTDINETIRRDCEIASFTNMGELFKLVKVNIENWRI